MTAIIDARPPGPRVSPSDQARAFSTVLHEEFGIPFRFYDAATGGVLVRIDPRYFRPTEVEQLLGDPTKAKTRLGWEHKVSFPQLVEEMVQADLAAARGTGTPA